MKWDYWTYQQQPAQFISDILDFILMEQKAQKIQMKEIEMRQSMLKP